LNPFKGKKRSYGMYSSGDVPDFFKRRKIEEHREKYWRIHEQGGIVTRAINAYPLYITRNDYRLESEDETLKDTIQEWLDDIDIMACVYDLVQAALIQEEGYQEKVRGRGNGRGIVKIAHGPECDVKRFYTKRDDHGTITGFEQTTGAMDHETTPFKPNEIFYLRLNSVVHEAYDDIMRDVKTAEATASAIARHGFGKFHIKVGKEGENIPPTTIKNVGKEFRKLKADNEFVTPHDIDIDNVDKNSVQHVGEYSDWSLPRMVAALGVPEELLGLRRGTTDATARTRKETFFATISAMQKPVNRAVNRQLVNDKLAELNRRPGEVKFILNDPDPKDEIEKMEAAASVMKASGVDPFLLLTQDEWRKFIGYDPMPESEKLDPGERKEDEE
jgi:hypothetical protein